MTEPLAAGSPVAFIGLGAMGRPMATRLAARFPLRVFDVDPGALAFWERGEVEIAANAAAAADGAAAVVLSLPSPPAASATAPARPGSASSTPRCPVASPAPRRGR